MATRRCGDAPRNARADSTDRRNYWHSHPYRPGKTERDHATGANLNRFRNRRSDPARAGR